VAVFPRASTRQPLRQATDLRQRAADLPLIRYTQRSVIGQQVERFLVHAGIEAPRRFEFDATDPMLSLVAAGLGWAISTPLCLWQARAWLDQVQLLPIPSARLGSRNFYLLCRDAEWSPLADQVASLTRSLLVQELFPALRISMPELPEDVIVVADSPEPRQTQTLNVRDLQQAAIQRRPA
jgi:DNA-binding transcriptional LysR family regulator